MGLQTISILKSVVFFIAFLFPPYICIPKGVQLWERWKKTKEPMALSHAVTAFMAAVFFYILALGIVIMRIVGYCE